MATTARTKKKGSKKVSKVTKSKSKKKATTKEKSATKKVKKLDIVDVYDLIEEKGGFVQIDGCVNGVRVHFYGPKRTKYKSEVLPDLSHVDDWVMKTYKNVL